MNIKRIIAFLLLSILLINTVYSQSLKTRNEIVFTEIKRPYKTISPYISGILKLKGKHLENEIKRFWQRAKQDRLPLIENDPLDNEYTYISFIYREKRKNKAVSLDVLGIYEDLSMGNRKLRHIENTDFYYRSYKVPKDICFSYCFKIKDIKTGKTDNNLDTYNSNRMPLGKANWYSYSVIDLCKNQSAWKDLNLKAEKALNSRVDTIQYTDKTVHKARKVYIYLPPNYDSKRKKAYPVIYLFDASIYLNRVEVPNVLDNMISEGKIEPMIAVMFGTFKKTRSVILPLNFKFKDEFINEFVPLIRKAYNVSIDPHKNIIGGMSYGGLAANFVALYHPEIFGRVLSQSASLWRGLQHTDSQGNWLRHDWLVEQYKKQDRKDIKLFLDWGLQENWVVGANRRMVHLLKEKGYKYKFMEFNGWHDLSNSRKTFPQGLLYLLK